MPTRQQVIRGRRQRTRNLGDVSPNTGVLVLLPRENPGAVDKPERWKLGEVVDVGRMDRPWAWTDLPIFSMGSATVEEINGRAPGQNALYDAVRVEDSGTITVGTEPVDANPGDAVVWMYPGKWRNFGNQQDRPEYNRCHIIVEDKTFQQVYLYIEEYNIKSDVETIAGPNPEGLRRVQVDNLRTSISGKLSFTEEGVNNVVTAWNEEHPHAGLTLYEWDARKAVYDGVFERDERTEFEDAVKAALLEVIGDRRRWYLPAGRMNALIENGGWSAQPASNINLRDRMLD